MGNILSSSTGSDPYPVPTIELCIWSSKQVEGAHKRTLKYNVDIRYDELKDEPSMVPCRWSLQHLLKVSQDEMFQYDYLIHHVQVEQIRLGGASIFGTIECRFILHDINDNEITSTTTDTDCMYKQEWTSTRVTTKPDEILWHCSDTKYVYENTTLRSIPQMDLFDLLYYKKEILKSSMIQPNMSSLQSSSNSGNDNTNDALPPLYIVYLKSPLYKAFYDSMQGKSHDTWIYVKNMYGAIYLPQKTIDTFRQRISKDVYNHIVCADLKKSYIQLAYDPLTFNKVKWKEFVIRKYGENVPMNPIVNLYMVMSITYTRVPKVPHENVFGITSASRSIDGWNCERIIQNMGSHKNTQQTISIPSEISISNTIQHITTSAQNLRLEEKKNLEQ